MGNKLLIVDDEAGNRLLLSYVFKAEADAIYEAEYGAEAIQLAQQQHPDRVFIDLQLPDMDGVEVVRAVRSHNTQALIIITSANDSPKAFRLCCQAGADGYIVKPFSLDSLLPFMQQLTSTPRTSEQMLVLDRAKSYPYACQEEA